MLSEASINKKRAPLGPILQDENWDERAEEALVSTEALMNTPSVFTMPTASSALFKYRNYESEDSEEHISIDDSASGSELSDSDEEEKELENKESEFLESKSGPLKLDPETDPDLFYDSEDSENERTLITIGDVPVRWYDDFDHIGYDQEGQEIAKPQYEDEIDRFVALNKSSTSWKSVYNEKTGERTLISERDMEIINRLRKGIQSERYDPENWFIPVATSEIDLTATSSRAPSKAHFQPSKWDALRMRRIAYAIRHGHLKIEKNPPKEKEKFFLIWDDNSVKNHSNRLSAPNEPLPGHSESYNPPAEYLMNGEEEEAWEKAHPMDRKKNFLPRKYSNLRSVPSYSNYIKERFERCLDLYLCSRSQTVRRVNEPSTLNQKLPSPMELRPFPNTEMMTYIGHEGPIRSISTDNTGKWMISGGDDKTVRLWEVKTGRCAQCWKLPQQIMCVSWNPNPQLAIVAVTLRNSVRVLEIPVADPSQKEHMKVFFEGFHAEVPEEDFKAKKWLNWMVPTKSEWNLGWRANIEYNINLSGKDLNQITWHQKGDYFATVAPHSSPCVIVHQLSKRSSQAPWKKTKLVQCVTFHPTKPFFFVATQTRVRIYNLARQSFIKKLTPQVKWISSISVHPQGDNVIVGSYDKKVCWFDLDLSKKPYKTLRYHKFAVRSVKFHQKYPLFASASDDGTIQIYHATVYDDLLKNPLIVPLKILRGHTIVNSLGVLNITFHPNQPWIFSSGADSTIRLFVS